MQPDPEAIPTWARDSYTQACDGTQDLDTQLKSEGWLKFRDSKSEMGLKYVFPAEDPELALRGNPLLCGTLKFNLTLATEQAGIALANFHLSPIYTSYLYNSLQQKEMLPGTWLEMEKVINAILCFLDHALQQQKIYSSDFKFATIWSLPHEKLATVRMSNQRFHSRVLVVIALIERIILHLVYL
jgi:hypothetical protein